MKILKYPVQMANEFSIRMPKDAAVLSVQVQRVEPQLWAIADEAQPLVSHHFYLRGTGHDMGEAIGARFVGTFQIDSSFLVFHLFDGGER